MILEAWAPPISKAWLHPCFQQPNLCGKDCIEVKCVSKKIGLELYLWLHFNFMTRKPIQMVQITYFDSMKTSQPKIIRFVNFFFEMVKKIYDASHVYFLALSPWFFWSLFDVSLHLRLNLINLGKLQCSFDVGEVATPPRTWQGFQTSNLLGLNEKNSSAKIWQIFWRNFLRKLVFLNFYFFTFF